ncbi:MAG: hypothetical protein E6R04_10760 [Spirochaetes bacterium]|nr:MAG: hypothetical protein E6R04_10760 [Spirochaetota bacterium]
MTEALTIIAAPPLLLRPILHQARAGTLATAWREKLPDRAGTAAAVSAELPPQDWEPGRGVGWRRALDAWHKAMTDCLAAAARADDELRRRLPRYEAAGGWAMDQDLATASYRAGMVAGGLDVEWFDWLIDRVREWPDERRRGEQLDLMTLEPGYRDDMQKLPLYWA